MRLWRLARGVYSPVDGVGAMLAGGRWNSRGRPVVYSSERLSLAALKVLVHIDPDEFPNDYRAVEIDVPDAASRTIVDLADLSATWRIPLVCDQCREIGDAWLTAADTFILVVPSAVVPQESNYLLNPLHPEMGQARIVGEELFPFDPRLIA
jgi:RES domain-containing protein